MSEQSNWMEFTRFVPGFDFLRSLAPAALGQPQGQSGAAGAAFQQWLAPTMDPAEVQKRIDELKVVKFWLEQNGRALEATIQALEVQKMTLGALGRMNRDAREMAQAFSEGIQQGAQRSAEVFQAAMPDMPVPGGAAAAQAEGAAHGGAGAARDAPQGATEDAAEGAADHAAEDAANPTAEGMAAMQHMQAQALQWWGALTEQFQAIAAKALDDIGQNVAAAQASASAAPAAAPAPAAAQPKAPRRPRARKTAAPAKARPKTPTARAKAAGAQRGSAKTRTAASPQGHNLRDGRKTP
ncbi:PhaM family polyhydroxyalkanoate granule multifunctional regulatory protein [Vandammella animalimorsus]|uniref:PhaM family polyhydroxyalkanoate granule multifunctional regulatory protein n=1 Tax=Vandammella animalimorsus TaxID=2029117 RepID=UPI001EEE4A21|nr:PhaM family polyhydroxyalkanoate granule multifunctional regulatory protein [Vandammella animalimorsus]